METGLRALLYVSQLAEGFGARCVPAILGAARANNNQFDETGVLVYDGERFCQYIEGPAGPIGQLLRNLRADVRHRDIKVLLDQPIGHRLFHDFRMGYTELSDVDTIECIGQMVAEAALARFMLMVSASDVEA